MSGGCHGAQTPPAAFPLCFHQVSAVAARRHHSHGRANESQHATRTHTSIRRRAHRRPCYGRLSMEIRILGPLEVLTESRVVGLGGAKSRALLAMLVLHANEPVSAGTLA